MGFSQGQPVWYSVPSDSGCRRYTARAIVCAPPKSFVHQLLSRYCFIRILDGWLAGRTVYAYHDELRVRELESGESTALPRKRGRPRKAVMS